MKKNLTVKWALSLFLLAVPTSPIAEAQEGIQGDHREKVMERIEMMRMWKMTEDLELTEHQGSMLFPFFRELDEERKTLNSERGRVMRELRATLKGENPDQGVIAELINRLEEVRAGNRGLEARESERIRDVLNPEQVARYIIFKQDFEREIREVILRARHPESPREIRERRETAPREGFPREGPRR